MTARESRSHRPRRAAYHEKRVTIERVRSDIGDLIADRFRVEQVLGRGGMGAVYRVRDERRGRPLALKRLRIREEERRAVITSLFEREFHTLSQLAHPAIISVYDYGIDAQGAYYTMELLDGEELLGRGRLEWRRVCAVLRDLASSLAVLHSRRLLHRDLAPGNVRTTRDGRAKLIDFGAMTAMGPSKLVVGTPPFVAPEALQLQALDGRADLFGLGALAYVLLTGRQAYPARHFDDLRRAWQQPPPEPHRIEASVPPALSQLVLELLHLDRNARPAAAAEVIERVCAIAELPLAERPEVMQAYLATPTLVGRERELSQIRMALAEHARGLPMNVLIEGDPGTGRSRFIDTCVLEAKLLGLCVLRADANDSARGGDYAVLRSLGAQLIESLPGTAREASKPWRSLLRPLLPALADEGEPVNPGESLPERRHLHVAVRDWLLSIARSKRFVIVIDDVDAIDEPSAALLSALAHKRGLRRSAGIVVSASPDASSPSLRLLREISRPIMLEPLSRAETEALLRSVFGDVDNAVLVAHRIHELSEGNPRAALALAQHLVDRVM
jgi:hypothetical protein